jgi:hypothetical protein
LMGHKITGINFVNHKVENLLSKINNLMIYWLMIFKLKIKIHIFEPFFLADLLDTNADQQPF